MINEFISQGNDFCIEFSLFNAIDYFNNKKNNDTKCKPIAIRDITDIDIIKKVNCNIISSMKYFFN